MIDFHPAVAIVINPPKLPCDVGVPKDVFADTVLPENNESVSVTVPFVIQFPKSIVIVPEPVLSVGKLKPENSNV